MSTEQPEALRLTAALDALLGYRGINADVGKAAAKLRRLSQVNAELLEALLEYKRMYEEGQPAGGWQGVYELGNEAIAKATKE